MDQQPDKRMPMAYIQNEPILQLKSDKTPENDDNQDLLFTTHALSKDQQRLIRVYPGLPNWSRIEHQHRTEGEEFNPLQYGIFCEWEDFPDLHRPLVFLHLTDKSIEELDMNHIRKIVNSEMESGGGSGGAQMKPISGAAVLAILLSWHEHPNALSLPN